jgi:hypothetical protein
LTEEGNKLTPAHEFLLGRLSEETRARFEDSFFNDDELFEQIEIAEDELIDDYLRNELSAADRYYFEQTLLRSPRIAERVKLAGVLGSAMANDVVQPAPEPVLSPLARLANWLRLTSVPGKLAYASLGVVLVVGGATLSLAYLRLREASRQMQEERAALEKKVQDLTTQNSQTSSERNRLNAELETQKAENARLNEQIERQFDRPVRSIATVALTLFSGGSRATGEEDSLRQQANPAKFQFNLLLEADDYEKYRVVVTTVGGKEVGSLTNLKSKKLGKNKVVTFLLSSTRFTPDDYVVELTGIKASGEEESLRGYSFRVLPQAN